MSDSTRAQHPEPWSHHLLHWMAGTGAFLCLLTPFLQRWNLNIGGALVPVRFWPGNLLVDGLTILIIYLLGFALGGWWWWSAGWRRSWLGVGGAVVICSAGVLAVMEKLTQTQILWLLAAYVGWAVAGNFIRRPSRPIGFVEFWRHRAPRNLLFFWTVVITATVSDCILLHQAPPGWAPAVSWAALRFLTELVIISGMWMGIMLFQRWAPRGSEVLGWLVVAIVPVLFTGEIILRLLWTKNLVSLCGELEVGGKFDARKAMAGANVEIPAGIWLLSCAVILAAVGFFLLCARISRKRAWTQSLSGFFTWAVLALVGAFALSAAESKFKSADWRQWQFRTCLIHLNPFSTWVGYTSWNVAMADPIPDFTAEVSASSGPRPDIYLFIVETFRSDAIRAENAPFLSRWRDEECQLLTESRSASNATHLSWFSILHGRLPVHWEAGRKLAGDAPLFRLLKNAGYRVEVRHPGDLDYNDMTSTNFGKCQYIDFFRHVHQGHPDSQYVMQERERRLIDELCEVVSKQQSGGHFYLTELDSPHYPYRWHNNFHPPLDDYEPDPLFPIRPTQGEITRTVRRYWNSIAWVDFLLGKFVAHLKSTGRYDNALIIVTGDHGEEFKEHGSWFHCSALNHEQTRVPIFVKWPASRGRGPTLTDASHLDILPTIAEAAGLPPSAASMMPGRTLQRTEEATSILTTCFVSQNGESLVWRRAGYEAAFSWPAPYLAVPPVMVRLERLTGPDGPINIANPDEAEKQLQTLFPDAFARTFRKVQRRTQ